MHYKNAKLYITYEKHDKWPFYRVRAAKTQIGLGILYSPNKAYSNHQYHAYPKYWDTMTS